MKKIIIFVMTTLIILVVAYGAGIGYYAEKFQANTTFGNVDISNMTLSQAQSKIEEDIAAKTFTITENGKEVGKIQLGELNPELKTEEVLTATYNSQDPNFWLTNYFQSESHDNALLNTVALDSQVLLEKLGALGLSNEGRTPAVDATIDYSPAEGYHVVDAKEGDQLDLEAVKDLIIESIQKGEATIEINQAYMAPTITAQDEKITTTMDQIAAAKEAKLTLEIAGATETVTPEQIEEWMSFDTDNTITYDYDAIYEWLGTLNDKYATYNKTRQFASTAQGEVTVQPGTLGWSIDREAEAEAIIADLKAGGEVTRQPVIVGTGYNAEGSDIGNSYVEISVQLQTMWVYIDGQVVIESPIVTGRIGANTIPGAYSIWNKESPSVLRGTRVQDGQDYEQPVDFWLPFDDTGQGIHDANWQPSFGGNVYQTSGSQGCINTPPGVMAQVYEIAYPGMPVIIYE